MSVYEGLIEVIEKQNNMILKLINENLGLLTHDGKYNLLADRKSVV